MSVRDEERLSLSLVVAQRRLHVIWLEELGPDDGHVRTQCELDRAGAQSARCSFVARRSRLASSMLRSRHCVELSDIIFDNRES